MADVKIAAQVRKEFGKGSARRARAKDQIPGVVYGHGGDPVHVTLPEYDLMMALKNSNVLITLDVEGKSSLVIPKAVQREALRNKLVHVDLLTVRKGEKVIVEVPIVTEGDLGPGQNLLENVLAALTVEAEATDIPESLPVSIQGLVAGAQIVAKDVPLPEGTALAIDEDSVVIQVLGAQAEATGPGEESAED